MGDRYYTNLTYWLYVHFIFQRGVWMGWWKKSLRYRFFSSISHHLALQNKTVRFRSYILQLPDISAISLFFFSSLTSSICSFIPKCWSSDAVPMFLESKHCAFKVVINDKLRAIYLTHAEQLYNSSLFSGFFFKYIKTRFWFE